MVNEHEYFPVFWVHPIPITGENISRFRKQSLTVDISTWFAEIGFH